MNNKNDIKKPYINEDGYYPQCPVCWYFDLTPNKDCPKCGQHIDWTWVKNYKTIDK